MPDQDVPPPAAAPPGPPAGPVVPVSFRLPRSAYLLVLVLAIAVTAAVQQPILAVVYVVPVVAAVYIARLWTHVDAAGITVSGLFGRRSLPWAGLRGLTVVERNVYAVLDNGMVRLPCVRISDLHAVSGASGGRLPQLARATPKFAPQRRRR